MGERSGLTVSVEQEDGLMTFDFGGLATKAAITAFAAWVADFPRCDEPIYALMARFNKATLCTTAEALTSPLRSMPALVRKLQVPGAILCRPEDLPIFRIHERLCEDLGIVRRAFDDPAKAWPWCQQKIRLPFRLIVSSTDAGNLVKNPRELGVDPAALLVVVDPVERHAEVDRLD
jgi:hypothetical protein